MWFVTLAFGILCLIYTTNGYYTLKPLSYTQLATAFVSGTYRYQGLNQGTAVDGAYDPMNKIVYVIGDNSHFMHCVDVSDPAHPTVLFVHQFAKGEGVPQSIDVCGSEIAVALSAQTNINEGHVRIYRTHTRGSGETDVVLERFITVGPHPQHLEYSSDCNDIIVTNEGEAGKDEGGVYTDPEGSVTIIEGERLGNPTVKSVDFDAFNYGGAKYNANLRVPSLFVPSNLLPTLTTVAQDLEPENVVISKDGKFAWVTLQENNAVARINVVNGLVEAVSPLPKKLWTSGGIDASDRDGGVHRRTYAGLQSLRQPGKIKMYEIAGKRYLITADAGSHKRFVPAVHGFDWADSAICRTIAANIEPAQTSLKTNALNDEFLGRVRVSTIDGKNPFTQLYSHVEIFGGRGFSIWDSVDLSSPIFDSEGTFEEYMEAYRKDIFNSDYVASTATYQSPEMLRDIVSEEQGAQITGLDIINDNGTVFLVAGTSSTGTLFLYTVDTSSGQPIPQYQSIYRNGATDLPWTDLYTAKTAGDLYITDLGIIPSNESPTGKTLVYVCSTGAGALSMYEIINDQSGIPPP